MKPENVRRLGLGAAVFGFLLIVVNALDYLTGTNRISSSTTVIGLMLVIVGMGLAGKNKPKNKLPQIP